LTCNASVSSEIYVNYTFSNWNWASANRTIIIEEAPNVSLHTPTTGTTSNSSSVAVNFTVTGDAATYDCNLYSNDTGSWAIEVSSLSATNNTHATTSCLVGHSLWSGIGYISDALGPIFAIR